MLFRSAVVLTFAASSPVVKVGRIAGQFAKPRTNPTEKQGDLELPIYRGDIINGSEFTAAARTPDPSRQIEAYRQSAATLNLLRAFASGGYADLYNIHRWTLGFADNGAGAQYRELADKITEALAFMEAVGVTPEAPTLDAIAAGPSLPEIVLEPGALRAAREAGLIESGGEP